MPLFAHGTHTRSTRGVAEKKKKEKKKKKKGKGESDRARIGGAVRVSLGGDEDNFDSNRNA
jgi:hypothetical protein